MASVINAEWLNQNSQRAYPFREDALRRPTVDNAYADAYAVPNGLVLDLVLATNFDVQPTVYMSALTLAGGAATAVIADASDGTVLATASAAVTTAEYTPVNFSGAGVHDDIRGTIVFGNLSRVADLLPDGIYRYEASETPFEARCCRPSAPCVSGIFVTNAAGSAKGARLRGDVALVAGRNVSLDFDEANNAIIINADSRYAYNEKCGCETDDNRQEILTVNGVSAPHVEIEAGECVKVEKKDGRIIISDTCSKPYCGCAELTFLNQKTNNITTSIGTLEQFANQLHQSLNEFVRNVLLSDRNMSKFL